MNFIYQFNKIVAIIANSSKTQKKVLKVKKTKRGYYEASFEILSENKNEIPNYEITDQFLKLVEQQIYEAPEYYLWTHKRWKHRR